MLLMTSSFASAEGCIGLGCIVLSDNPLEFSAFSSFGLLFTTAATRISTEDAAATHYSHAAREDAAAFVASDGELRGAFFEAELHTFRKRHPSSPMNDREFARLVLNAEGRE
ncbi:DUF2388 domain-containing protein [Pseudomonas sp. LS44]|uniref:DUF2388 domain-containing protein n=1 Tax=Pseudomonas sp. LS44 TaxID=1357074 RepID=UPI00215B76C8|nr:DUF2388 domain-containing protein [Pseudomonas sp. LS44]UVE17749.1 DUF2388 domain-containing protein [Pseudomonas sp. LS44]